MQMVIPAAAGQLLSAATAALVSASCMLTNAIFAERRSCSMCLLLHMDEPHTKPNAALVKDEAERRSA